MINLDSIINEKNKIQSEKWPHIPDHPYRILKIQSHVPKDVRLNSTHFFIMKINSKRELQNIAINHSADIDYKGFMRIYRECTKEPFNFMTIDTTLPASNPLRFRKNLFDTL